MGYVIGSGTTIDYSTDAGTTWIALPEAHSIDAFGTEGSFVDATTLADTTKKYVAGIKDTPEINLVVNHDAASTAVSGILAAANAGETVKMKVTFPDGQTATFDMALSGYTTQVEGENLIRHTIKGKQSGDVVFA